MTEIPKIIHYCWFGRKPLPKSARHYIERWKKFFPGYEIKEWNEDNFDVYSTRYTAEAYQAEKYAFVSDYARFKILYDHGGIYFDTDVEVIKSFEDILSHGPFWGCEISNKEQIEVNPGLGMGARPKMPIYNELLQKYDYLHFLNNDGSYNFKTIVAYTTELLKNHGLSSDTDIQTIEGITIYPKEYFNPLDDNTGRLKITANTHSIHWYTKSWLNENSFRHKISQISHRILGNKLIPALRKLFK